MGAIQPQGVPAVGTVFLQGAAHDRLSRTGQSDEIPQECSMVVQAYILIQTDVGKAAEVAAEIADVKGVTLAEDVTGPYDVIVRAEARNVDELGKLVVARVQNISGITRTLTCPVVHI
jgi:DNA-binding Lrp family transcriptional regulator